MTNPSGGRATGCVQPIRTRGIVTGYQLRIDGGGAGKTKFFAALRLGGPIKALRAANKAAKELGLVKPKRRGGSDAGRVFKHSVTGAPGIRFVWTPGAEIAVLRVVASWVSKRGIAHSTSYSVEHRGLEGALDLAIKARTSAGAPSPDKADLLKKLRKIYANGDLK